MNQSLKRPLAEEGLTALLWVIVVGAVLLFPSPLVIYLAYLMLFVEVAMRAHRWLQKRLRVWERLIACGFLSLGLVGWLIFFEPYSGELLNELHPAAFRYWTIIMTLISLLQLFIGGLRDLWRGRQQPINVKKL